MIRASSIAVLFACLAASPVMAKESSIEYDQYGHAAVIDEEGWVYVNKKGEKILRPFIFDNGPDYFSEGLARFVGSNGKIGFHDEALNIVIPAQFDFARPFEGGVAETGKNCRNIPDGEHMHVECPNWSRIKRP